jgi:hypothetical protein
VRRGLHDIGFQAQRPGRRLTAETHIGDVRAGIEIDAQQHVASRGDRILGLPPKNPRRQAGHAEAERPQRMGEEQVHLETPAAAPIAKQLLLERGEIQADGPPQQRVEILERDRDCMPELDAAKRFERWHPSSRVADPLEIGANIDRRRSA